jgi:hypothetical protein
MLVGKSAFSFQLSSSTPTAHPQHTANKKLNKKEGLINQQNYRSKQHGHPPHLTEDTGYFVIVTLVRHLGQVRLNVSHSSSIFIS